MLTLLSVGQKSNNSLWFSIIQVLAYYENYCRSKTVCVCVCNMTHARAGLFHVLLAHVCTCVTWIAMEVSVVPRAAEDRKMNAGCSWRLGLTSSYRWTPSILHIIKANENMKAADSSRSCDDTLVPQKVKQIGIYEGLDTESELTRPAVAEWCVLVTSFKPVILATKGENPVTRTSESLEFLSLQNLPLGRKNSPTL